MTKTGTVHRWDAARGFGFIRSPGSSADVFFHVRDYRGAGSPPVEGTEVRFEEIHVGGKGPRAMAVQPLATPQRAAPRRRGDRDAAANVARRRRGAPATAQLWVPLLMLPLWLGLLGAGLWLHRLPWWAVGALAAANVLTLFAYAFDKNAAENGRWRTAEDTLHGFALMGGWPAAWLAQQALRHKSSKVAFRQVYALTVMLHCAALAGWVVWLAPRLT
ncbi:cold shock and DUF1294 domain-containing protein [Variovorax fucosicus]|uniref:cold shock and DUF1294 domain-containing protein n=1 Tax=Variovorax fucosicus TaxID=3053517 RepID=UPI0025765822|nr:cold shock and DUF1294 domain-containing protein [Variovorax sp. J22G47]MDM0057074.1 cold shock and DUF1294 domain-containing protein [Variovorax sp. J22G47]